MNISLDFITCISHSHIVSVMGVSVLFNKSLIHVTTQLSNRWKYFSAVVRILH